MGQDFFTYLPSEMIMNILSRLPIRSIIRCKLVCKSWLDLLATPEFVKSHLSKSLSKSAASLAVSFNAHHPKTYKFFEFVDELNLNRCELSWDMDTIFNFKLPCAERLHSSANGLLFLCGWPGMRHDGAVRPRNLFICNPITRDYITIPCPHESFFSKDHFQLDTYGFGVSRMSGQYKLVRMLHGWIPYPTLLEIVAESECQVYTVGTGSWRRISSDGRPISYGVIDEGVFLNGNLHWPACEREGSSLWISCLDLETELFSTFPPPFHLRGSHRSRALLSALGECLCLCDNSADDEIVIWLMKEYGDEKSWTKEFVISRISLVEYGILRPIKVFEKGGILMVWKSGSRVLYFSSNTKTIRKLDLFELNVDDYCILAIMYTPSFVSLKTFAVENVTSF